MINARKNKLKKQMKNINSRSLFSKQQRKISEKLCCSKLKKKKNRKCKKAWNSMKEIIAKSKPNTRNLPGRIVIGEKEIFDRKTIAKQFNDYFINIGLTFASNFQT